MEQIDIDGRNRRLLFAAFFFTILLTLLFQFYRIFSFFIVPLTWAAVLALVFHPLYRLTLALLRGRENASALLFTVGVILVVIVPTAILALFLVRESVQFVEWANELYTSGRLQDWLSHLGASPPGLLWERVAPLLREWKVDPATAGLRAGEAASQFLVTQVAQTAANALELVGNFFLVTFALFFFLRDGELWISKLRTILPMEEAHKHVIFGRLHDAFTAVVQGTLVTAAVQGLLATVGFWLCSVPFAILLGGATALLSILPFGTALPWMGAAIFLVVAEEYARAGFLAVWGILVIGSADNIVRPLIIGERTQIPTVFLFFSILGGLRAYGFLGMFLGPVLVAILVAVLRIYRDEYGDDARLTEATDA